MKVCSVIFTVVGILTTATVRAEVDCSKRLDMNVKTCCKIPEPNWTSFKSQCNEYEVPTQRAPSPCFLECVFNSTNAVEVDQLNMPNVRNMLNTLMDGNQDFVDAYVIGFEKCIPVLNQRVADFKAKNKGRMPQTPSTPNCPMIATFYAMCAHKNVFIACPASAWTSTAICENAREYATTCEPQIGGPGGRRGQGSRRGRRQVVEGETSTGDGSPVTSPTDGVQQRQGRGQRRRQGMDQGQGTGQGQGMGMGQGQGMGMGQGQRRGRSQRQGTGQGQGQGMGQGQGQGMGQGQRQGMGQGPMRCPGPGRGRRRGQGQGEGQSEGQGQGEDVTQNTGTA